MQLEGGFAAVERRGDMVPGHLQQGRALQCGIAAAAKGFVEPVSDFGGGEIAVGGGDDQGGARQDAQDLGHAWSRPQYREAAGREMGVVGDALAGRRESRVALAGGEAAAHGLHLDDQIDR